MGVNPKTKRKPKRTNPATRALELGFCPRCASRLQHRNRVLAGLRGEGVVLFCAACTASYEPPAPSAAASSDAALKGAAV